MQLKVRWVAIPFLAEHGDNHLQSLISTCNYKFFFFLLRGRNWKAIRLQISNILGVSVPHRCSSTGKKRYLPMDYVTFAKVYILHRTLLPEPSSAEGSLNSTLPPVSEVVLLLCQASRCRPVGLCFGNMSVVFHYCCSGCSPLAESHHLSTPIHTCLHRSHREIFARFSLLPLPPPLKTLGMRNVPSWIMLSLLVRFSVKDFGTLPTSTPP